MFGPITLPFGAKMLFNTVTLKPGFTFEDIELAVGELCSVVKETYGGDKGGFLAGQVFKFSGFVSEEGSLATSKTAEDHYVIVTYWRSFEDHERSHANELFSRKFSALLLCVPRPRNWATTCSGKVRLNSARPSFACSVTRQAARSMQSLPGREPRCTWQFFRRYRICRNTGRPR